MRTRLTLRSASPADGIEVWQMLREIGPGENGFGNPGYHVPYSRFEEYLESRVEMAAGRGLVEGTVPMTTFWCFAGARPVGVVHLRHRLTSGLRRIGGHIGYCIRPSARGRGYGNDMLRLALLEARRLGIAEALITVDERNVPSWRVVEANGGRLASTRDGMRSYRVRTGPVTACRGRRLR